MSTTMATQPERKALNEGTFREANERLNHSARDLIGVDDGSLVPFLCECPKLSCTEVVLLTLREYEVTRAEGARGFAMLGHEDPTIERVLDRNDRFVVTEKFGEAGDVHRDGDPRK